jgi:hypothetical protein
MAACLVGGGDACGTDGPLDPAGGSEASYDSTDDRQPAEQARHSDDDDDDDDSVGSRGGGSAQRLPTSAPRISPWKHPSSAAASSSSSSSSSSSAAASSSVSSTAPPAKSPNWSVRKDLPRMMSALMNDITAFASRDKGLTRLEKDNKDTKAFWATCAVLFNDPTFKTILFECPDGHEFHGFSASYSGHKTDSSALETTRFGALRTELDRAFGSFAVSGGGDGGAVEPGAMYVMSSKFWNFCNGNLALYYFYIVLVKHGALKCAVSAMESGDSFGSDMPKRPTTGHKKRTSTDGGGRNDDGGGTDPVEIKQSEDQKAASKSKRTIYEAKAMTASDDAMASLINKHE